MVGHPHPLECPEDVGRMSFADDDDLDVHSTIIDVLQKIMLDFNNISLVYFDLIKGVKMRSILVFLFLFLISCEDNIDSDCGDCGLDIYAVNLTRFLLITMRI